MLDLSADLVSKTVESKIGTVIEGQMEAGLIYTGVYIARVKAIVRGVLRGSAAPLNLKTACSRLDVHDVALNALIPNIVSSLIKEDQVKGTYQKGSMIWTPTLYGQLQDSQGHVATIGSELTVPAMWRDDDDEESSSYTQVD